MFMHFGAYGSKFMIPFTQPQSGIMGDAAQHDARTAGAGR